MDRLIYFDNASTTFPKPDSVHDAVRDFYSRYGVNPGRTGCELALRAERLVADTRRRLSELFNPGDAGKDPNRLVFTHNATMSLNLIIGGCVGPGDHVVLTALEHNAVIRPVNHKVAAGAARTVVAPDAEGYVDPADIRRALRPGTRLVVVNHASNVTGAVQDLAGIGAVCREAGVPLAVDAAQTAGVLPIDMGACHASFVAFTGHKGLFGPTGTGGICVADDAEIRGTLYGGTGVRSAEPLHPEDFPLRLEAGTLNLAGIAGLAAGLDFIAARGREAILEHELSLLERLQAGLADIAGVRLVGPRNLARRVATLSFTVAGHDAGEAAAFLEAECCLVTRPGLQCAPLIHEHHGTAPEGTVRMSLGPFNTVEEVDAAVAGVAALAAGRTARVARA